MLVEALLRFMDLFKWVFKLLGVNYSHVRNILWAKLTIDTRRTYKNMNPSQMKTAKKKKGIFQSRKPADAGDAPLDTAASAVKTSNNFGKLLWMHFFGGLFLVYPVIFIEQFIAAMLLLNGLVLIMSVMSIVTHFTPILLDTSDNSILLPQPLKGRTIFVARSLHILYQLFAIAAALSLGPWITGTVKYGVVFFFAFLISLVLTTMLAFFFVYLLFLSLMHVTGGSKFRDVLTMLEIIAPIILALVIFSMGDKLDPQQLIAVLMEWVYFIPPAWFAGMMDGMVNGAFAAPNNWLTLLAFMVPLLCMGVVVWFLAPTFNRKLAQMEIRPVLKKRGRPGKSFSSSVARLFCGNRMECNVFEIIWTLSGRNSKFKLNTYPILGFNIMFFAMITILPYKSLSLALEKLPGTQFHLTLMYISCLVMLPAISQLPFCDNFKGARMYKAVPISHPGAILGGAFKAIVVKFSPPTLGTAAAVSVIWGPGVWDDILACILNLLLLYVNMAFIFLRTLPFSWEPSSHTLAGKMLRSLAAIVLFVGLAMGHYFLTPYRPWLWAATVLLAATVAVLYKKFKTTGWQNFEEPQTS
ncbi:MAG: hypothetical protein GY765_10195 [bacterium]|nr:hypothetical protein [bacterium]